MPTSPNPLVSYAQNGEDIVLARALKPWENKGFWVDCGAGHPKYNSVTKLFSELGWTGINIEPLDDEFALLTQDRERDQNIQCLLGAADGEGTIFAGPIENRGSSTTDPLLVEHYAKEWEQIFQPQQVSIQRLDTILRAAQLPQIDFLKIDVEGAEYEVLQGINLSEFNPRILIIEAVHPNSTLDSSFQWEDHVFASGYVCAYFDGLNKFYVKNNNSDLLKLLQIPANVTDNFLELPFLEAKNENAELRRQLAHAKEDFTDASTYAESLRTELDKRELKIADSLQRLHDIESLNMILESANMSLERRVLELQDFERQLNTIRSYKIFQFLSFSKKLLRRLIH